MELSSKTVTRRINSLRDLTLLMSGARKGDTIKTTKTTLVLVHKTGAGPRGLDVEFADADSGNRWVMSLAQIAEVLGGREIAWTFGAGATVPVDPKVAAMARRKELELECLRMTAEYGDLYPTAKKRNTRAARQVLALISTMQRELEATA